MDVDAVVAEWCARDGNVCVLPADRAAVEGTVGARALIVELVIDDGPHRDLFSACAVLGRLIAERGGSPTLAASTLDGACVAIRRLDAQLVPPMRGAIAEGFAAGALDAIREEAAARWEYPGCAVPLEGGAIAIAGGYPDDDGEALAAWASRVASAAARGGARRAVLSGGDLARHALADALTLAGIQVRASSPPRSSERR